MSVTRLWVTAIIRRAWGSLMFIGLVAGVGGAVVLTAVVGAERTRTALDRAIVAADPPSARVQSDGPSSIARLADVSGVRAVHGIEMYPGGVEGFPEDIGLLATPREIGRTIDRVELERGRQPDPGSAEEVMLTSITAEALGKDVGDSIAFASLSREQLAAFVSEEGPGDEEWPPGPEILLRVVGIGNHLLDRLGGGSINVYVAEGFSQKYSALAGHFGGPNGLGDVGYVWIDDAAALAAVGSSAGSVLPGARSIEEFASVADPVRRTSQMMATGVLLFALIAGLALATGIAAAVHRHLTRGRADQATLSSLGAPRRRVVGLATAEVVPAAVLAGVVVIVGGIALVPLTPFGSSARQFDPAIGAGPGVLVLVAGAVLSMGVVVVAAAASITLSTRPRRRAARVPAAPATWSAVPTPAASIGVWFALASGRGQRGAPGPSILVAGALGVAGVVGGLAFAANLRDLEASPARWGWTWSLLLDTYLDAPEQGEQLLTGRADVAAWGIITDVGSTVEGTETRAMSLDVRSGSMAPKLVEGRLPSSPDEVVLGTGLARTTGAGIGDIVRATTPAGEVALVVVGRATLYPTDTDLLSSASMLLTPDGLAQVATSDGFRSLAVKAADGVPPEMLHERLSAVLGERMTPAAYSLASPPLEIGNATQLRPVPLALAGFLGALGLALVAHALWSTPKRRGHELSVLRALGMRPRQAGGVLGWQALVVGAASVVVGVPLGLIAGRIAFSRLAADTLVDVGAVATPGLVVAVIVVSLATTAVLALWPARRAAALPIGRLLRTE